MKKSTAIIKAELKQKIIFERLIQLYMYEMSENYPDWSIQSDGLYEYDMLDKFWQHPYLLYIDDNLAGFALIIKDNPFTHENCWFMAEFFLLKNQRGSDFSAELLNKILQNHPGDWCVSVLRSNLRAKRFWEKVLPQNSKVSSEKYDDEDWKSFRFNI